MSKLVPALYAVGGIAIIASLLCMVFGVQHYLIPATVGYMLLAVGMYFDVWRGNGRD